MLAKKIEVKAMFKILRFSLFSAFLLPVFNVPVNAQYSPLTIPDYTSPAVWKSINDAQIRQWYPNNSKSRSNSRHRNTSQGGIGIAISQNTETKKLVVAKVLDNSPAAQAGIREEDIIVDFCNVAICMKAAKGSSPEWFTRFMRGPVDGIITLRILRNNQPMEFKMKRVLIITPQYDGG